MAVDGIGSKRAYVVEDLKEDLKIRNKRRSFELKT